MSTAAEWVMTRRAMRLLALAIASAAPGATPDDVAANLEHDAERATNESNREAYGFAAETLRKEIAGWQAIHEEMNACADERAEKVAAA